MKPQESFELVTLKSGIMSLRSTSNLETFHPVTGPSIEAQILHVDQPQLVLRASTSNEPFIIWDVGLGAAANALTAIKNLLHIDRPIEIHSFDRTTAPLEFSIAHATQLGYLSGHEPLLRELIKEHRVQVTPHLSWFFHEGDFTQMIHHHPAPAPHSMIYDPYSSAKNPEMWTLEHFTLLFQQLSLSRPCLLTNYTRSTAVRTTLLLAGFYVGVGQWVGEKAETTIASNSLSLLNRPLDRKWLERVRISRNASPLRAEHMGNTIDRAVSELDLQQLLQLTQFKMS